MDEFKEALKCLADTVTENLGGSSEIVILDNNNRETTIEK